MLGVTQAVLVYLALGAGGLATVYTMFVQLRSLRDLAGRRARARALRRASLATCIGMGSVCAPAFALQHGGPGAIGWMWIASFLGMALTYAEVVLSLRAREGEVGRPGMIGPIAYLREGSGGPGKAAALLFAVATIAFTLAAGAALQGQQGAAIIGELLGAPPLMVAGILALAAAPACLGKAGRARRVLLVAAPAAVVGYLALLVAAILTGSGSAFDHLAVIAGSMFESGDSPVVGAAAGGTAMVMQWGVLRATLATEAGLGTVGLLSADEAGGAEAIPHEEAHRAGAAAMLLPLLAGGVISTLTALALMSHDVNSRLRIDDPLAESNDLDTPPRFSPLERPHSRGSKASMERGQTFVLPVDSPLEKGKSYPMVMRADPRGHMFGKVSPLADKNVVATSDFGIAENIDTIVFRDAHETRRDQAAYDLRIPVTRTVHRMKDAVLVALEPVDPQYDLKKLRLRMMGPYLVLDDFRFQGTVSGAFSPDPNIGEHLAMFEHRPDDARLEPVLRTILSLGYRGPYLDDGGPPPPTAMVAREGFDAPIGTRLRLRMESPARGLETGQLIAGDGVLRVPAWDFLAGTTHALLRHHDDAGLDRIVAVRGELVDGFLRFESAQPEVVDFHRAAEMKDFTGPYLLPPPYDFEVEVHAGVRAPDPPGTPNIDLNLQRGHLALRRTLVPIHPLPEGRGGDGELYTPHPSEVAALGMKGPFLLTDGGSQLSTLFAKAFGTAAMLPAIVLAFLAVSTLAGSAWIGRHAAVYLAGERAGWVFRGACLVAAVGGGLIATNTLLAGIDLTMAVLLALNLLGIGLLLPKLRSP